MVGPFMVHYRSILPLCFANSLYLFVGLETLPRKQTINRVKIFSEERGLFAGKFIFREYNQLFTCTFRV